VRTIFLLEYLSDVDLRRLIQSATNKSERFNQFVQWVAFGGGALAAEGSASSSANFIKYNHLVANLLIYHNVVTITRQLRHLAADGRNFVEALVSGVSPYQSEHINRFGRYGLNAIEFRSPSMAFGY
jgi:TnpA family transposase